MSKRFPIVAATGSSGAGTTTVKLAFEHIFSHLGVNATYVEGDSYHRYDRKGTKEMEKSSAIRGENFSHFGPAANDFEKLEETFRQFSGNGTGCTRHYVHSEEEAERFQVPPGQFTDWQPIAPDADLLFYEGLHAGVVTEQTNVAQHVDLLVGIVPTINLEWAQKVTRDTAERGYSIEEVTKTVLRRMPDYMKYILPQFSRTDVNFQRVPTVDVSNPFDLQELPTDDQSMVVIHFRRAAKEQTDFPYLLAMIHNSFMANIDTLVVPGGKMGMAIELIFAPLIQNLMAMRGVLDAE